MKKFFVVFISTFYFLISANVAFARTDISLTDITFSKSQFTAGETIRIYARVQNSGDTDVSAHVQFLHNGNEMAVAQPASLKPNTYDDVFIDWKVIAGTNAIFAKIIGVNPEDSTPANNQSPVKTVTVAEPEPEPVNNSENSITPIERPFQTSNWQEILAKFQESNPVKSGIDSLDQTINNQVLKWYTLAIGDRKDEPKLSSKFSNWQASAMAALGPYLNKNNTYAYVGAALLVAIVLFFLFRRRRTRHDEHYD